MKPRAGMVATLLFAAATFSSSGSPQSLNSNKKYTLTGYCFGMAQDGASDQCALFQDPQRCPAGQTANEPVSVHECQPPSTQLVDASRTCSGTTRTGLAVFGGNCIADSDESQLTR